MGILKSFVPYLFKKNYYILRFSNFARSGNIKLIYTTISLLMCFGSFEYFLLYSISTIIWSFIEFILQKLKIRKMSSMFLSWNNNYYNVPIPFNYLLQGSMEAGFIITFGIYFSDYPEYKFISLLFILFHTLYLSYNQETNIVHSKRLVNKEFPLSFLLTLTIIDMIYIYISKNLRALMILYNMILIGSVWTLSHVIMKTRRVVTDNNIECSSLEIFKILAFDVIIEMGIMYIPFYFITQYLLN
jgi:hypothetical protein